MKKLSLVEFRPCLDQPLLPPGQGAGKEFHGLDSEHPYMLLVIRMEMRRVMRSSGLRKHSYDDPEEARQFGHAVTLPPRARPRQPLAPAASRVARPEKSDSSARANSPPALNPLRNGRGRAHQGGGRIDPRVELTR